MIRVLVNGALGRMGTEVCKTVMEQKDMDLSGVVDINGADKTIPYYEFKQSDIDSLNAQHVKAYINDVLVVLGSKLKSGQKLKFVCDNGYKFDTENTLGQNPQPRYSQQRMTGGTNSGGQISNINANGTEASILVVNDNNY